jgi:uncharacterized DUF497 family protein
MYKDKYIWDEEKHQANIKKYGITFQEASDVFDDEYALIEYDPEHSIKEDRYVILGFSHRAQLLMVCHCYRDDDEIIRIFSARKANKAEREEYGGVR